MDTSNNPNKQQETAGRLPQLDAMRGVAALWVVLYHWSTRFDELYGHAESMQLRIPDGRHGVHLFFMISGFVILMTLDKVRSIRDFAFFRFARLYPTLWACAAVTFFTVTLFGLPGRAVSVKSAVLNITMVPHQLGFKFIDESYWSLEVELFFYVLMAALVGLGLRRFLVLILAMLVVSNIGALLMTESVVVLPKVIKLFRLVFSLRYLHLFLFGIICYELTRGKRWWHYPLLALCLMVPLFEDEFSPTRTAVILMIGLLFWGGTQRKIALLGNRVLVYAGMISYPLYLLHQNVGYVLMRESYHVGLPGMAGMVLAALLVFPLAALISTRIELPVNQYLRGWYRARLK